MSANSIQVGGSHYQVVTGRQHWDLIDDFNVGYLEAGATKYITRWRDKDGLKDLRKAGHFLQKLYEKRALMNFQQQTARMPQVPRVVIQQYVEDNQCGEAESYLIALILTWQSTGTIDLARKLINEMIAAEEGSSPSSSYVNQD